MLEVSLIIIIILVLVLPITVHFIEKNLEAFLFFMGILAVTFSHFWNNEKMWSFRLVKEALVEPIMITLAVVVVGIIVFIFKKQIEKYISGIEKSLGREWFTFSLILFLGLFSSFITAIMAAILLVEIISVLKYQKGLEIKIVILGCFSIGFGAALTPIGEPLSTIMIAKLRGGPYYADFFFLLRNAGQFIIPGILFFSILGFFLKDTSQKNESGLHEKTNEKIQDIFIRGGKVYLFIMALIFLGAGFKPIIDKYIIHLPGGALYWINILSAVMDNATLSAAEISPKMSLLQIKYVLMGLLIAGGMLIPGNIPNIISAGRLGIKSKQWAKYGVPLGFIVMIIYFLIFEVFISS
ncbi:MAG: DUF1646 family protein [Elusimicrobia bacterium]|nr:DUF1646 family protein [Elusimicrobiota bacterium]